MRIFARTVARNKSIREIGNTNMFQSNFKKIWRLNGKHPENLNGQNATKKGARPRFS